MKRSLLIALFCVVSLSGSSALVAQTINPLLLQVDLEEGWRRVETARDYGEYVVFEKDGPCGKRFVRWKILAVKGDQKDFRALVAWEIVLKYGCFFEKGNLCRLTEDGREMLGLLKPR